MPDGKLIKTAERKERLAAELRANLKKRKAQSRARQQPSRDGEADGDSQLGLRQPNPSAKG